MIVITRNLTLIYYIYYSFVCIFKISMHLNLINMSRDLNNDQKRLIAFNRPPFASYRELSTEKCIKNVQKYAFKKTKQ